jgi:hypothetical protein
MVRSAHPTKKLFRTVLHGPVAHPQIMHSRWGGRPRPPLVRKTHPTGDLSEPPATPQSGYFSASTGGLGALGGGPKGNLTWLLIFNRMPTANKLTSSPEPP